MHSHEKNHRKNIFVTEESITIDRNLSFQIGLFILLICVSCTENQPSGEGGWLKGNDNQKFEQIAKHLRGFDMAMVETGHRYNELFWAGKDQNWEYAKYQIQKIRLAVENGLERRPKRAASAETFLKIVLPEVEKSIDAKDATAFWNRFGALTSTCNACHASEKVTFVVVSEPEVRTSPVRLSPSNIEEER
ncbi:hypothetical protein L0152_00650 [bacterium]|nr:hypothetical protein [bacterium]